MRYDAAGQVIQRDKASGIGAYYWYDCQDVHIYGEATYYTWTADGEMATKQDAASSHSQFHRLIPPLDAACCCFYNATTT
ncbi:MAG: hypothetical protein ABFE07_27415 [Armatimonadia bacterium]